MAKDIIHAGLAEAAAAPAQLGRLSALVWRRGTMELRFYKPPQPDPQVPHDQDELYIVVAGRGRFVCDGRSADCNAGDVLFAPAKATHRFENTSADFAVWVVFYGAKGGENPASAAS